MSSAVRLFFALWPDSRARMALSRLAQDIAREGQGRAPRDSNLHLTLAFLGEVPQARIEALLDIGQRVAVPASPFLLTLDRIGGKGHGIAWLAPPSLPEPLHRLQATLSDTLAATGFVLQQRVFRPHITLARDCVRPVQRGSIAPIAWEVGQLSLVASTLAAGGSQYRNVGEWPLAAAQSSGIV